MKKVTQSKRKPSKRLFIKRLCSSIKFYAANGDNEKVLRCVQLIEDTSGLADITKVWKEAQSLGLFLPPVGLKQK